jgi:hypothetical protein
MPPTACLYIDRSVFFLLEMIGQQDVEELAGLTEKLLIEV